MEPIVDRELGSRRPGEDRAANAHAASHGYGAARAMAQRLVADWSAEDAPGQAAVILDQPEQAQAYAESVEVPFEDYLTELRAARAKRASEPDSSGEAPAAALANGRDEDLYAVYAAGFDIGFRSALIEQCEAITESLVSEAMPTS